MTIGRPRQKKRTHIQALIIIGRLPCRSVSGYSSTKADITPSVVENWMQTTQKVHQTEENISLDRPSCDNIITGQKATIHQIS